MAGQIVFPSGFLWGAATSAHQVEGGNDNDWTEWEKRGGSKNLSGKAANHWDLVQFQKDVELMRVLGLKIYRLSIEWSRVMPKPGLNYLEVLEHYRQMLKMLKAANIKAMVTLHHFTNPVWFAEQGGWLAGPISQFYDYVHVATLYLAADVDYWVTINEPLVMAYQGWLVGEWPPGKKGDVLSYLRLQRKLTEAHNTAYKIVKRNTGKPTGIVHQYASFETAHNLVAERFLAWVADRIVNRWLLEHTRNDFIGINFYMRRIFSGFRLLPESGVNAKVSDFGWEINPKSLTRVLLGLKRYNLPIFITENGVADAKDSLRPDFIRDYIAAVWRAIQGGVDVKGYIHWSLIDNFEWSQGYTKKFGLVGVDFETQARRVRSSFSVYQKIIRDTGCSVA